jgi:hypothetical protein
MCNMIKEACDKFRNQLENWFSGKRESFSSYEISNEWMSFKENNPEYSSVFDDIYFDYIIKEGSYRPRCLDFCCEERATVKGIVVKPIDWDRYRFLINYKTSRRPSVDFIEKLERLYPLE